MRRPTELPRLLECEGCGGKHAVEVSKSPHIEVYDIRVADPCRAFQERGIVSISVEFTSQRRENNE